MGRAVTLAGMIWFLCVVQCVALDSSVGRAVDCSSVELSIGRWFKSGSKELFIVFSLDILFSESEFLLRWVSPQRDGLWFLSKFFIGDS